MSTTQGQEKPLIVMESPALGAAGWLPPVSVADGWPSSDPCWDDLEDMRMAHLRLLYKVEAHSGLHRETERQYEDEDKARAKALQDSMRDGTDQSELPEITPPEARQAELARLKENANAARRALDDFLREAEQRIEERGPDWLADLDAADAKAMEAYEVARRAIAKAEAEVGSRKKLRLWLGREAGQHPTFKRSPARHFPYREMGDPPLAAPAITPEQLAGGIQVA